MHVIIFVFFFFQAEDGIRDKLVTGVQTCALPISFSGNSRNFRKLSELPEKEPIREATQAPSLTSMQESSAMRSYGHSRHARGAWAGPMALPRASERTAPLSCLGCRNLAFTRSSMHDPQPA